MSPRTRAVAVLGTASGIAAIGNLPALASAAGLAAVAVPLLALSRRVFRTDSALTPVLAAFTLFWFGMLGIIELLSAFSLLGSRAAWTAATVATAVALQIIAGHCADLKVVPPDCLRVRPLAQMLGEPWSIVVAPLALACGAFFLQPVYLNLYTGINHTDGQLFYVARSIRYLQDGTLWAYSTINDFLPHFHQTVSAYLLLFYGTPSAILLLSSLFGGMVGLALFDLSRLTGVPVSLSVLVGVSPHSVTIFSLHLGSANFDVHTALLLVLAIYFLVLLLRTCRLHYLVAAACATALALAIKPTFWFAAPGLGLLWLAALVAVARQRDLRTAARGGWPLQRWSCHLAASTSCGTV